MPHGERLSPGRPSVIESEEVGTKRNVHNCHYLALAEALDGRLVTADGKFFQALGNSLQRNRMLWMGDLLGAKKALISGNLYILDLLSAWPVHNPEINTETIITIVGFLGAILLLLDVVVIR